MRRSTFTSIAFTVGLLFTGGGASAQMTGSIEGRVTDSSGAALPGVNLRATSPSLQGVRTAVTGRDGAYRIPALPPGRYRLEARRDGFQTVSKNVVVSLDVTTAGDLALPLAARENVVVSGDTPLVDTTSATGRTQYTNRIIARLPVRRNYADIVRSNPGVAADRAEVQGGALPLSIYGATSVENQWMIDGINTTNVLKGFQGKALNNEFIEEIEVRSGGYQAEYGRALGGIVNVITKSGGNRFRGDAFVYYDSESLRARQIVTDHDTPSGMRLTSTERREIGADVGGFVLKDRLWFFVGYDRTETPGNTSRYFSSRQVPSTMLFPRDEKDNLYSGKLTWNIANRATILATLLADPSRITGAARIGSALGLISSPDPGTWESRREIGGTDFGLRGSQLFGSAAVLSLQASRHRDRFELFPSGAGDAVRYEDHTCEGGTAANPCVAPDIPNSASGGLGSIGGPRQRNSSRRDQLRADLAFYLGNHELRLGADYEDARSTVITAYTGGQLVRKLNESGTVYYAHDFFAANAADLIPAQRVGRPRNIDSGFYLQDSWRTAPGLTVNVGLRYDEEDFRDSFDARIFKTTDGWQPRLGVVWDPSRSGRMKIYASAGRFSYSLPTRLGAFVSPFFFVSTYNFDPVDTTQSPDVPAHPAATISPVAGGSQTDANMKGIYQDELAVGFEILMGSTFSLGLRGIYRRLGRAIEDRCDLDFTSSENNFVPCAFVNPGSDERYARGDFIGCNGLDGDSYQCQRGVPSTPEARRLYRGIELIGRTGIGERLWLQASYIYSSLRGNYDGGVDESNGETNPGVSFSAFDFPAYWSQNAYGKLSLDRPHSFRADVAYTAPFGLFVGLDGFIQSGAPINKLGYFNASSIFGSPIHLVPRGGAGRLPTVWEANFTMGFPIILGPLTATLQAYIFNLFNNQIEIQRNDNYTIHPLPNYPASLYDPNVPSNNSGYGKIVARQDPRLFRMALRVSL
jgi:Carboxypeptidase regulatory-like domain/TonB dependent receptor-like, beta-barrel/TonB-dependent Receptor Plug Domain